MVDPDTGALVLVRARQGMCGETRRVVHLTLVPSSAEVSGPLVALCGASLVAGEVEPVASGAGVPDLTGVPGDRHLRCGDTTLRAVADAGGGR